jgi:methanogenic corrinoid protein MtbC1
MPGREERTGRRGEGIERGEYSPQQDVAELARPLEGLEIDHLRSVLRRVVNAELVPQLILAEKSILDSAGKSASKTVAHPTGKDVADFQVLVLHEDTFDCFNFINALRARGVSLPSIYLGLFAPLAKELGQKWESDDLSFIEVTKAVAKMQSLVHTFSEDSDPAGPLGAAHRIVLASPPEEQHRLGMLIVSRIFEMEGWDVSGGSDLSTGGQLNKVVHDKWFGVVGLSASSEQTAVRLKQAIDDLRAASKNRSISVIVGGNGFIEHPEISRDIGADDLASDVEEALQKAERLIKRPGA